MFCRDTDCLCFCTEKYKARGRYCRPSLRDQYIDRGICIHVVQKYKQSVSRLLPDIKGKIKNKQ